MTAFMPRTPRHRRGLALIDAMALAVGVVVAHAVRFSAFDLHPKLDELLAHPAFPLVALATLWAVAVAAELYEPAVLRRGREVVLRVVAVAGLWAGLVAFTTYVVGSWRFGRGLLALTATTWAVLAVVVRIAAGRVTRNRARPVALVVGPPERTAEVCARLRDHPLAPWEGRDASLLAADAVGAEIRARGAELVILAGADSAPDALATDLAGLHFAGVPVVAASEVWAWVEGRLHLDELSPTAFFHQPGFGAIHWELFNRVTRVVDVALAALMLLVALPVLLLAALCVLVLDGRPVVYRQVRLGQFGRPFTIFKLRTMRRDAEEAGPAFAAPDDPRVTRIGRVLRRLRLDELPQLVNVLRGDMSLVGPRPERPEFASALARTIPYYTFRLAVPPGLTGWAQVNMRYARTEAEHRVRLEYDLYFIRERSVALYVLTLLRTVSVALLGTSG